jgi:hypothetical protein
LGCSSQRIADARQLVANRFTADDGVASEEVHVGDRSYRLIPDAALNLQPLLDALEAVARPGQRLYVGPHDLRFAEYNDTFVYYLLPKLKPASIYMEDDPATVNGPGHDLSADIRRADFLVLNRADDPIVPNPNEAGSSEPNQIVGRDFCPLLVSGTYELLARRGPTCD